MRQEHSQEGGTPRREQHALTETFGAGPFLAHPGDRQPVVTSIWKRERR